MFCKDEKSNAVGINQQKWIQQQLVTVRDITTRTQLVRLDKANLTNQQEVMFLQTLLLLRRA